MSVDNATAPSAPELLDQAKAEVEPLLAEALARIGHSRRLDGPSEGHQLPRRLAEAMRYALLSPGKRLRPALVLGGARAVSGRIADVLPAACAVEMIHAYSLVHDDLPALDDADMRRDQPSCHKQFDEATALLAGDALLTEALALVADSRPITGANKSRARHRVRAVFELARAIGAAGMVGGQTDDVDGLGAPLPLDALTSIHRRKTGRLIQGSVAIGGLLAGGRKKDVARLRRFGSNVGLAFQLIDDLLDKDGVAALVGVEAARREALRLTESAISELSVFGKAGRPLAELAASMARRAG